MLFWMLVEKDNTTGTSLRTKPPFTLTLRVSKISHVTLKKKKYYMRFYVKIVTRGPVYVSLFCL